MLCAANMSTVHCISLHVTTSHSFLALKLATCTLVSLNVWCFVRIFMRIFVTPILNRGWHKKSLCRGSMFSLSFLLSSHNMEFTQPSSSRTTTSSSETQTSRQRPSQRLQPRISENTVGSTSSSSFWTTTTCWKTGTPTVTAASAHHLVVKTTFWNWTYGLSMLCAPNMSTFHCISMHVTTCHS